VIDELDRRTNYAYDLLDRLITVSEPVRAGLSRPVTHYHDPAWQGDPRNIAFLRQGSGQSHMTMGHPGGTRAPQPSGDLIDRQAMLEGLE